LCSFLWPDSDVERARGSLKQSLYTVRRDLGAADIVIGSTDLRLNPEIISSDVREFRRALASGDLEAAVSTYAGPLLDGVHLRDADDFERWSEEVRRELAAQYAKALDQLTTQAGAGRLGECSTLGANVERRRTAQRAGDHEVHDGARCDR
jgi:DNA-binding SARP family transcriptional activator